MGDRQRRARHERSCPGKRRFDTRGAALGALMVLVRTRGAVLGQHETYRCTACSSWHFGHKMRKGKPRG